MTQWCEFKGRDTNREGGMEEKERATVRERELEYVLLVRFVCKLEGNV